MNPSAEDIARRDHHDPGAIIFWGYLLAILLPLIGFVIGLTQINRNPHGLRIVLLSVAAFVVFIALLG